MARFAGALLSALISAALASEFKGPRLAPLDVPKEDAAATIPLTDSLDNLTLASGFKSPVERLRHEHYATQNMQRGFSRFQHAAQLATVNSSERIASRASIPVEPTTLSHSESEASFLHRTPRQGTNVPKTRRPDLIPPPPTQMRDAGLRTISADNAAFGRSRSYTSGSGSPEKPYLIADEIDAAMVHRAGSRTPTHTGPGAQTLTGLLFSRSASRLSGGVPSPRTQGVSPSSLFGRSGSTDMLRRVGSMENVGMPIEVVTASGLNTIDMNAHSVHMHADDEVTVVNTLVEDVDEESSDVEEVIDVTSTPGLF